MLKILSSYYKQYIKALIGIKPMQDILKEEILNSLGNLKERK